LKQATPQKALRKNDLPNPSVPLFSGVKRSVPGNPALARLAKSRKVLLLQGPVGSFYDRLTRWLQAGGAEVHRVVFQGGDAYDCKLLKPIAYRGTLPDWPAFLEAQIAELDIDCVVLFGQSRRYHAKARALALARNLPVVVLEEGYFRPGFMTMELGGVNGYSTTLQQYLWRPVALVKGDNTGSPPLKGLQPDKSPRHFQKMAWQAGQHYIAMHQARAEFPHYVHHRNANPYQYLVYWARSWTRKLLRTPADFRFQHGLFQGSRPYYFVPLQHDGDAQITHHSPFSENTDFVIRVMRSFAGHAPADAWLVFRQHPQSRGGPGHTVFISSLAAELGMTDRVHHMVEGDTPDLAERAAGVVVINSTVGLQALERGAPLMALGDALYKQAQLTFMGELDAFWGHAHQANKATTSAFLAQMKNLTQAPVSLYALRGEPIGWPSAPSLT
jgi:capsular polysaccharide export protein